MTKKEIASEMAECLRVYLYTPGLVAEIYDGKHSRSGFTEKHFNESAATMVVVMEEAQAE